MKLKKAVIALMTMILSTSALGTPSENQAIERAVKDYIESQHQVKPGLMAPGTRPETGKTHLLERQKR